MVRAEVPDTTVFIKTIRDPDTWSSFRHRLESDQVWLSSVVATELYAGTRSRDDAHIVDRIVGAMSRDQRVLTPTRDEWIRAGRLLHRFIRLRGDIRPRDHLSDVLILVSAARLGGSVLTANVRHFEAWATLARSAGLDVQVSPFTP